MAKTITSVNQAGADRGKAAIQPKGQTAKPDAAHAKAFASALRTNAPTPHQAVTQGASQPRPVSRAPAEHPPADPLDGPAPDITPEKNNDAMTKAATKPMGSIGGMSDPAKDARAYVGDAFAKADGSRIFIPQRRLANVAQGLQVGIDPRDGDYPSYKQLVDTQGTALQGNGNANWETVAPRTSAEDAIGSAKDAAPQGADLTSATTDELNRTNVLPLRNWFFGDHWSGPSRAELTDHSRQQINEAEQRLETDPTLDEASRSKLHTDLEAGRANWMKSIPSDAP